MILPDVASILDAMQEGLIAIDAYERIVLVNEKAARIVGSPVGEVRGKYLWDVIAEPTLQGLCRRALRSPGPVSLESSAKIRDRQLEATASPVPGGGAVLLLLDVTELHRLERVRRDFVANVSHELRTPLASIVAYVETLRSGALEDRANADRFLQIIGKNAQQMTALVSDLLELSRLESERGAVRRERVSPAELLQRTYSTFEPVAEERGLSLTLSPPAPLPDVAGDVELLERALNNLVDNAIKYTERGGVTLGAVEEGRGVCFFVQDTGVGIPTEEQGRIFERFYRVDKSRSREIGGTGLGLAIVKHIVRAHDGTVRVESVPGSGSTFRFVLPATSR